MKSPKQMVVIFLDIDGVLNSEQYCANRGARPNEIEMIDAWEIDPVAVQRLNAVVELTGAAVVLSSDWRKSGAVKPGVTGTEAALRARGATFRIESATPVLSAAERRERFGVKWQGNYTPRGLEIQSWLDKHPEVERFAIVDDNADMEHLREWLVETDPLIGLSESDCHSLVSLLSHGETPRDPDNAQSGL